MLQSTINGINGIKNNCRIIGVRNNWGRVTLNLTRTGSVNLSATFLSTNTLFFEVVGQIQNIETFAYGSAIMEIGRLRRQHEIANWRKRKGIATVRLSDGTLRLAEVHWYEATGIG